MSENEDFLKKKIRELENSNKQQQEFLEQALLQINNMKQQFSELISIIQKEVAEPVNAVLRSAVNVSKMPLNITSQTLSLPSTIFKKFPELKYDSISKAIISALERKGSLNISQLTEQVRKERGSASRRIVRERVDKLIESGIIVELDYGYGRQLELDKFKDDD